MERAGREGGGEAMQSEVRVIAEGGRSSHQQRGGGVRPESCTYQHRREGHHGDRGVTDAVYREEGSAGGRDGGGEGVVLGWR